MISNRLPPITDAIIVAVSKLVDDSRKSRSPSHYDLTQQIKRADLSLVDPQSSGSPVGKSKRVSVILNWAYENDPKKGSYLISLLISTIKGCGGFREESPNYSGTDEIQNVIHAFKTESFVLNLDGELFPLLLDDLEGNEFTSVMQSYIRRAVRGYEDAALVTGTGKDLLEATAAHVITTIWGKYPADDNFPTLLGKAFTALGLSTPANPPNPDDPPIKNIELKMYEIGCKINTLRNKEGTGHGRPWLPSVTDDQAKFCIKQMAVISEYLINCLKNK